MNFGNYSIITKKDAKKISEDSNLNSNYSGTLKIILKTLAILIAREEQDILDHLKCHCSNLYFILFNYSSI